MKTTLVGFATLSQFIAGLTGSCGILGTLAALHSVDPVRWPLTADALRALQNDEILRKFAAANGAENIPAIDGYLTHLGIAHRTVGYAQFTFAQLHANLRANAGKQPMVVEWALAGMLPGDERGDHYHFSTAGGIDTGPKGDGVGGGYLFCDGDNSADDPNGKPRPPVMYTIQDITKAQPIGYVVLTAPVFLAGWSDDGTTLTAPNGKTVHFGFRDYVLSHAPLWASANVPTTGEFGDRGGTTERFTSNQLHWDGKSVMVEALPPPAAPPPPVDWQAKYEQLRTGIEAALRTA